MKGVTFEAWRGGHYVSLAEILLVLGRRVSGLKWRLRLDEVAPHAMANQLEAVPPQKQLGTLELLRLVTPDVQIVDGAVLGYIDPINSSPILVIRAVDSTSWDVESESREMIATIRGAFPDAVSIPR